MGLFDDAVQVERYLGLAVIQVRETIRTPFTPDLQPQGSALISLQSQDDRHILIVMADSLHTLADVSAQLESGEFCDVIVSDLLVVIAAN